VQPAPSRRCRPQAEDTDPLVDARLIAAYRAMTPEQKAARIAEDSRALERLALAGIALRYADADARERLLHLAAIRLGPGLLQRVFGPSTPDRRRRPVSTTDPVALALRVAAIFEELGVPCVVGGSFASSVFGEPRSTEDVDFVADLHPPHVAPLIRAFGDEFYVDEAAIHRAIERRSSFNVIHLPSARKVDVFVPSRSTLAERQLQRRRLVTVSQSPTAQLYLLTPEDTILQKLVWFRHGGGVSDRQWRDVLGIMKVQGDRLDWDDLRTAAEEAGLREALEQARAEATGEG
jgi:hypothetical protein